MSTNGCRSRIIFLNFLTLRSERHHPSSLGWAMTFQLKQERCNQPSLASSFASSARKRTRGVMAWRFAFGLSLKVSIPPSKLGGDQREVSIFLPLIFMPITFPNCSPHLTAQSNPIRSLWMLLQARVTIDRTSDQPLVQSQDQVASEWVLGEVDSETTHVDAAGVFR